MRHVDLNNTSKVGSFHISARGLLSALISSPKIPFASLNFAPTSRNISIGVIILPSTTQW